MEDFPQIKKTKKKNNFFYDKVLKDEIVNLIT